MGTIMSVCTSAIKGIQKSEVNAVELRADWGIENDTHAGAWHRQVSLLSHEKIEEFKAGAPASSTGRSARTWSCPGST